MKKSIKYFVIGVLTLSCFRFVMGFYGCTAKEKLLMHSAEKGDLVTMKNQSPKVRMLMPLKVVTFLKQELLFCNMRSRVVQSKPYVCL